MNLSSVKLVTFDVFGTVVDWRSFIEKFIPGRYSEFLKRSEAFQRTDHPILPYAQLLDRVLRDMGVEDASARNLVSQRFGTARPFLDFHALSYLRRRCLLGCISNSDHRHQNDVQRSLGFPWDLCILSEDIGAYKPHESVWRKAFEQVYKETRIKAEHWLHVSAYLDYDLEPAAKLGIQTCFIPRPGGSQASDLPGNSPHLLVSDFHTLTDLLCAERPVSYAVTCTSPDEETRARFHNWIRYEHGPELMRMPGCSRFCIYDVANNTSRCEYLFSSRHALQSYLDNRAPAFRQKGIELFGEGTLTFERQILPVVAEGSDRSSITMPV